MKKKAPTAWEVEETKTRDDTRNLAAEESRLTITTRSKLPKTNFATSASIQTLNDKDNSGVPASVAMGTRSTVAKKMELTAGGVEKALKTNDTRDEGAQNSRVTTTIKTRNEGANSGVPASVEVGKRSTVAKTTAPTAGGVDKAKKTGGTHDLGGEQSPATTTRSKLLETNFPTSTASQVAKTRNEKGNSGVQTSVSMGTRSTVAKKMAPTAGEFGMGTRSTVAKKMAPTAGEFGKAVKTNDTRDDSAEEGQVTITTRSKLPPKTNFQTSASFQTRNEKDNSGVPASVEMGTRSTVAKKMELTAGGVEETKEKEGTRNLGGEESPATTTGLKLLKTNFPSSTSIQGASTRDVGANSGVPAYVAMSKRLQVAKERELTAGGVDEAMKTDDTRNLGGEESLATTTRSKLLKTIFPTTGGKSGVPASVALGTPSIVEKTTAPTKAGVDEAMKTDDTHDVGAEETLVTITRSKLPETNFPTPAAINVANIVAADSAMLQQHIAMMQQELDRREREALLGVFAEYQGAEDLTERLASTLVNEMVNLSQAEVLGVFGSMYGWYRLKCFIEGFVTYDTAYNKQPTQRLDVLVDPKIEIVRLQEQVNKLLAGVSFPSEANNHIQTLGARKEARNWEFESSRRLGTWVMNNRNAARNRKQPLFPLFRNVLDRFGFDWGKDTHG